ncbi:uncharacterized protein METZ01_LOCUS378405, partial [marine metagenome]
MEQTIKTVYSDKQRLHALKAEISSGKARPTYEKPERADMVVKRIQQLAFGEIVEPEEYSIDLATKVHDAQYVEFLQSCWPQWEEKFGPDNDAMASVFCHPDLKRYRPQHI